MRRTIAGLAPAAALPLSRPLGLSIAVSVALSFALVTLSLPPPALAEDQPSLEASGLGAPGPGWRRAASGVAERAFRAFDDPAVTADPGDPAVTADPGDPPVAADPGDPPVAADPPAALAAPAALGPPTALAAPAALGPPVTLEAEERTTGVFRIIPRKKSLGLFLAAQAVILIDMGQTLDIRNDPGVAEANPLFGPEPSRERVYAVFGARLAVNTLAHWLLPDRWANALSMLNLVVGIPVVANNASLGLSVSF